jgi:hypothetical protein
MARPVAQGSPEAPDPIRHNDRVFIQGKTESGKTILARHLFSHMKGTRRTVIDPKGHLDLGVEVARIPEELDLAAPLSHYIPSELEDQEYEDLFRRLWFAGGPRMIWLDESAGPTRKGWAPKYLRLVVQQGREPSEIGLVALSQRPVNVESTLRTEAEHVFIFVPRPIKLDLKTLAGDIGTDPDVLGRELDQLLAHEGPHSHLWYCRRLDKLFHCAALPPQWAR